MLFDGPRRPWEELADKLNLLNKTFSGIVWCGCYQTPDANGNDGVWSPFLVVKHNKFLKYISVKGRMTVCCALTLSQYDNGLSIEDLSWSERYSRITFCFSCCAFDRISWNHLCLSHSSCLWPALCTHQTLKRTIASSLDSNPQTGKTTRTRCPSTYAGPNHLGAGASSSPSGGEFCGVPWRPCIPGTTRSHVTGRVSVGVVEFPPSDLRTANLTETEHMSSF